MLQRLCMPSLERVGGEPATNSRSHSHAYIFLKVSGRSVLETSCMHWYPSNYSLKSPSNLDCRICPPKHDSEAWKAFADLESRYPLIPFGASMKAYSLLPDWNAGDTSLNPIDLQVRGWLQNNTTNSSEVSSSIYVFIFATLIFLFACSLELSQSQYCCNFILQRPKCLVISPTKWSKRAQPRARLQWRFLTDPYRSPKRPGHPFVSFGKPMKSPRGPDSNETGGHDSQSCLSEKKVLNIQAHRRFSGKKSITSILLTRIKNMPWSCYIGHLAKYFVKLQSKWMFPPQQSKKGTCRCPKRPRYSHQRL